MNQSDRQRVLHIARSLVKRLQLNLDGLRVVTECASGSYALTPVMALMAGAKVYSIGRDTRYGKFSDLSEQVGLLCSEAGLQTQPEFSEKENFTGWPDADIVLNSGMIRPITADVINRMKSTAVIPLMWETWEFRPGEIDLSACRKKNIPVIGTNENYPLADMYKYPGMLAIRLMFDLKIDVANNRIALLGGALTGRLIADTFRKLGLEYAWFTSGGKENDPDCFSYEQMPAKLKTFEPDVILFAEHHDRRQLFGKEAELGFEKLAQDFPDVRIGHICGNIDADDLQKSGLVFAPEIIAPFGYMSYLPEVLGPKPGMVLSIAGLKVGEIAARARLSGASAEEAIRATVQHGVGQDFEGGFFNLTI
ncbi:MAG: hypothetical protein FD123_3540 [Bacteroidetes bacterium]|nr:MAG: hypothetical protein FD123_3540 [Bacteroidota bacterium]